MIEIIQKRGRCIRARCVWAARRFDEPSRDAFACCRCSLGTFATPGKKKKRIEEVNQYRRKIVYLQSTRVARRACRPFCIRVYVCNAWQLSKLRRFSLVDVPEGKMRDQICISLLQDVSEKLYFNFV